MAYHRWFASARDPQGTGVIGIIHLGIGRDNCPDWDIGMKGITVPDDLMPYKRRDTRMSTATEVRPRTSMTVSSPSSNLAVRWDGIIRRFMPTDRS